jgi:hypothetical protein
MLLHNNSKCFLTMTNSYEAFMYTVEPGGNIFS